MFWGLAGAVEELEIPLDSASLAEVLAVQDRLAAKVAKAVAGFDAAKSWDLDGDTSMTAWLRHHGSMTTRDASVVARTGRRLRGAPVTAGAWLSGELSGGQVAAVVANVGDDTAALWADHEADVVPTLAPLGVSDVAVAMGHWAVRAEATLDPKVPDEAVRSLFSSETLDGRREVKGSFDAESGVVLDTALREATTDDAEGEPRRTPSQRRADALVDLCRFFLDHQETPTTGRHRPNVSFVVKRAAGDPSAGATAEGTPLSPEVISRVLCDCGVHRVVTSGRSTILDHGRRTQTISAPLFNSLVIRDRHCRWPGCDRPPRWCEGHHVTHWEHGGATEPANLVLLCTRHHHRAHMPGWHVKLLPDATFEVTTPIGTQHSSRPPPW